jgi:hypothetical protein
MRVIWIKGSVISAAAIAAASSVFANRMTFEVWPDTSPDHAVFCSVALSDGWISLVQVTGAGMPGPQPMRWRASSAEVEALSDSLQAFVGGELGSVDPYASRQPPAPFLTVTWMTRLDDRLTTGLYIQRSLILPEPLQETLTSLGLDQPCGLTSKVGE